MLFTKSKLYESRFFSLVHLPKSEFIPEIGPYICDSRKKILCLYTKGRLFGKNSGYIRVYKKKVIYCMLFALQNGFLDIYFRLLHDGKHMGNIDRRVINLCVHKNYPGALDFYKRRCIFDFYDLLGSFDNLAMTNYIIENSDYTLKNDGDCVIKWWATIRRIPVMNGTKLVEEVCKKGV